MPHARLTLILLTVAGTLFGFVLAYRWPSAPLLAYWLMLGVVLGLAVSLLRPLGGMQRRLTWLVVIFAVLIGVSLVTTQLAARRAISSTHLQYRGVHLVGVDTFTVGVGAGGGLDVRLHAVSSAQAPWSLRVRRGEAGWELAPLFGIEQLRVRHGSTRPIQREYDVARSAVLRPGETVTVIGPGGEAVDTVRFVAGGLETASGSALSFTPDDGSLSGRYRRRLLAGTALANLDGPRSGISTVYERFVRVQEVSGRDVVNGAPLPLPLRLLPGSKRYLVSAAPPYGLHGERVDADDLLVRDSAFVEVRRGEVAWRFALLADWRRQPGAQRGAAILFDRHPRPLDTPLPVGVSCQPGAACGAISLRRLPPPVAHVALDHAGFDPERFGLLGVLRVAGDGYEVVLPRATYRVERGRPRPVAVPVTSLGADAADAVTTEGAEAATTDTRDGESRWVLLAAAGESDNVLKVALIGLGIALLLGAMHAAVRTLTIRGTARHTLAQERAIALGLTALLGLILTRVAVGARVAFFDPFLGRGVETAVGLCAAIAVVVVGLLTWSAWLPPFLAGARSTLAGQSSLARVLRGAWRWTRGLGAQAVKPQGVVTLLLAAASLVLLTWITGAAPWRGLFTGVVVLLVWVCVAWVAAFTGQHFDTYERGAQSLLEHSSPLPASDGMRRFLLRVPELNLILAFFALTFAHMLPRAGLLAAAAVLIAAVVMVWRRRHGGARAGQPDYIAAALGVAAFGACIAVLRMESQNGSLGAFVLVVFVALASVRIGRGVAARLEARARSGVATRRLEWLADALLLTTPLFLLLPLAGIDMGLVLVLVIPLGCATLLATGVRAAGLRLVVPAVAMLLLLLIGRTVVFPSMRPIREADSHAAQAAAFARMSTLAGMRVPILTTPMDRAAARSVATRDRALAEALLVAASPGAARDLLLPSIEQIWGAKAYASAGPWGEGLGQAAIGGRGVAETVSYAENTFAVFVLAEHGAAGGVLVLALYALLVVAVTMLMPGHAPGTPSYRASRALFLVAALIVAIPACYVALSNLGLVPITGQNMPFLGLNAWSDVAICAGVVGILITGTLRGVEEPDR